MSKQTEEPLDLKKELLDLLIYIIVVGAIVFCILHFVGQRTVVHQESMYDTLKDGDNLIMDKLSYRLGDPERFDIVIFPGVEEGNDQPYLIKRLIALPGETVQIKDGKVYINGEELTEDVYGTDEYISYAGIVEEPYTLGEDEYFCMGDNREHSWDCRSEEIGMVKRDEFIGKAWIRIWPLSEFGNVDK